MAKKSIDPVYRRKFIRLPFAKLKKEIANRNRAGAIRSEADLQAYIWHFLTERYSENITIHCECYLGAKICKYPDIAIYRKEELNKPFIIIELKYKRKENGRFKEKSLEKEWGRLKFYSQNGIKSHFFAICGDEVKYTLGLPSLDDFLVNFICEKHRS